MTAIQLVLNVIIAILLVSLLGYALTFVALPLEQLIYVVLSIAVVVLTFKYNAASQLGV